MDGVSGPGVGSAARAVHAGWVAMIILVGRTKSVEGVTLFGVVQAVLKKISKRKNERIFNNDRFMVVNSVLPSVVVEMMSSN